MPSFLISVTPWATLLVYHNQSLSPTPSTVLFTKPIILSLWRPGSHTLAISWQSSLYFSMLCTLAISYFTKSIICSSLCKLYSSLLLWRTWLAGCSPSTTLAGHLHTLGFCPTFSIPLFPMDTLRLQLPSPIKYSTSMVTISGMLVSL